VGGTAEQGNGADGVTIIHSPNNDIGGAIPEWRNVISGNFSNGVTIIDDTTGTDTAGGNRVRGNFIGTDATGTAELGNVSNGIAVSANGTVSGGTVAGARNVISGNGHDHPYADYGIYISKGCLTRIEGNFIGTDVTGTRPVGNSFAGVQISDGVS